MHGATQQSLDLFGTVYRRDLTTAIMSAQLLAFGLTAADEVPGDRIVLIAAIGAWFGWIDEEIQRITEVNLVLPYLSILIMVGTFYSKVFG